MGRAERPERLQDEQMSADEKHFADNSLLAIPLRNITWLVLRFPRAVLLVGLLLAIFSVVYTANYLGFRTSRLDLLNPNSAYNQRWLDPFPSPKQPNL